ncbi:MAG: hypothetical protein A2X49_08070 [Lentisphaerae bacterium GWF2_52_8]|nr:MAG: hypothetical protein A2X49_08070 [Lentisphaerae bacterium GWF2_52_8]
MITDSLEHAGFYAQCSALAEAFKFLQKLSIDAPEGKTPIRGDDIYANISSYKTKPLNESIFEAHRKYIDIQMLLQGGEGIGWALQPSLKIKEAYSEERDVALFERPSNPLLVPLSPGLFSLFFPHDVHMPCVSLGKISVPVKKVVVKIRASLVEAAR